MISESVNGYFFVMLDVCDCSVLTHLLHPDGDFVWIHQHRPDPSLRWWSSSVPVTRDKTLDDVEIRLLEYDLMMPLEGFRSRLDDFLSHGMQMTQLDKPVPDSLWLRTLPEDQEDRILMANGMKSRFFLPHAGEVAQFSCVDRDHLEAACSIPEIEALLLKPGHNKLS